jgi:hypothetical protein
LTKSQQITNDVRHRIGALVRLRLGGMTVLLLMLAGTIFIVPAFVTEDRTLALFADVSWTVILISGIVAVVNHRKLAASLAALSALAIAVRWAEWSGVLAPPPLLREGSTMLAVFVLGSAVAINVFASGRDLRDRIFGAIVLYLLIGLTFAVVYAVVERVATVSFEARPHGAAGFSEWVYFSFVTLTTVGFGDITPATRAARALTTLEALVGQLYPAIIIARLVSLKGEAR